MTTHLKSEGILHWLGENQGKYGLPVMFYRSCDSHKINITRVLLSKVDMHKMDC